MSLPLSIVPGSLAPFIPHSNRWIFNWVPPLLSPLFSLPPHNTLLLSPLLSSPLLCSALLCSAVQCFSLLSSFSLSSSLSFCQRTFMHLEFPCKTFEACSKQHQKKRRPCKGLKRLYSSVTTKDKKAAFLPLIFFLPPPLVEQSSASVVESTALAHLAHLGVTVCLSVCLSVCEGKRVLSCFSKQHMSSCLYGEVAASLL